MVGEPGYAKRCASRYTNAAEMEANQRNARSLNAALSWLIHNGLSLLTTYVNDEVGGIRLANGTRRRLQITLVDDAAQEDAVKAISIGGSD